MPQSRSVVETPRTAATSVRLVIADDFAIVIEFVRKMCRQELRIDVVGEAATGGQAIDLVGQTHPDMLLLDLNLPGLSGFQVIEAIRRFPRSPRILILSSYCNPYVIHRIEEMRVAGYLCKSEINTDMLRSAISSVATGGSFFSKNFLAIKEAIWRDSASPFKLLSNRESEILAMVGDSLTDSEIAQKLKLTERTVEGHRLHITTKLDLGGRVQLQRFAREQGFGAMLV
jgi:two-component system nitrate/nitrite response regulator NarL